MNELSNAGDRDKPLSMKDMVCPYLTDCINSTIYDCNFPCKLKEAELCHLFKNCDSNHKVNYRRISVLPVTSRIYESVIKDQINLFFKDKFSRILCGFRESYSTQHALIRLIENWRKCLDKSGIIGTILMDLSKAYDCLPHDFLIAKFKAYGFDFNSLCLLYSYLDYRHQRVKIGPLKSTTNNIKIGIPQGSVLSPLLFNISINDLFFMKLNSEICNFADDNTLCSCGKDLNEIVTNLEIDLSRLFKWFAENSMVANPKKFQLMFLGLTTHRRLRLNIEGNKVSATDCVKLLGVEIENKLKFDKHSKTLF